MTTLFRRTIENMVKRRQPADPGAYTRELEETVAIQAETIETQRVHIAALDERIRKYEVDRAVLEGFF